MMCPACGRPEDGPGCRMCHFVHDNMADLDATVVSADAGSMRLLHQRPPWQIRPSLKVELMEAWARYPTDPHA